MKSQKTESKIVRYGMWCRPSCINSKFALCGVLASFLIVIVKPVTAISIAGDDEIANEFGPAASDNSNLNFNNDPAGEFCCELWTLFSTLSPLFSKLVPIYFYHCFGIIDGVWRWNGIITWHTAREDRVKKKTQNQNQNYVCTLVMKSKIPLWKRKFERTTLRPTTSVVNYLLFWLSFTQRTIGWGCWVNILVSVTNFHFVSVFMFSPDFYSRLRLWWIILTSVD